MKRILLIMTMLFVSFMLSYSAERPAIPYLSSNPEVISVNLNDQISNTDQSSLTSGVKVVKQHKKVSEGIGKHIVAFLLGFLFGLLGVLIAFLIFLKHPERKYIMRSAWQGLLLWLLLFSLLIAL